MKITFDAYSGRPNPVLAASDTIAAALVEALGDLRMLGITSPMPSRLGYRGVELELPVISALRYGVARISSVPALVATAHLPLLTAIWEVLNRIGEFIGHALTEIARVIKAIIDAISKLLPGNAPAGGGPTRCAYERLPFDAAPWNDPTYIRTNNCYAYGSNKRALYSDKPQPGIASGRMFDPGKLHDGADVAAAAKRDGAHDAGDCLADSEKPRGLVALVIWPGEDYHWYRHQSDCWGHKPGSTPARNTDDSAKIITDPSTCDRGPYTIFHGYMLMGKSQRVAA